MQGLQPHEFFFHAMGGREGVIDTAIKTSDSGYTQRRLVKAMEDMTIHFDGTVRNSIGDIIQFKYGEDNMDGSKLIPQKVNGKKVYLPLDLKDSLELRTHLFGRFTIENKELTPEFNEALKHMDMSAHDSYVLSRTQDAKITPGEMVGIIAAQSLGQPITQMTLNTFHHAGCSAMNVTLGVPRLKELINVSKSIKSPSMRVKTREPDFQASELCGVYIKDLILRGQILEHLESPEFERTYIRMMDNEAFQESIEQTDWSILYEIDIEKLHAHGLDLLDITVWINKTFNHVWCSCSDENAENPRVIVRLFVNNNGLDSHAKMKQLYCKMTQETVIQGYKNISQVLENEGYIETLGIDMENVMANARVDPYRTRCNDVMTTFNTLGIEAARQVLYDEICKVIEFDGSYVDYRHTAMLIDTMTYKGSLMAITRHGINRTETGVLMRCSFEETVNVITDAAAFGEYDPIRGVTENIIMGKMACLGTGTMDVMVDAEKFMNSFCSYENPNEFVPSNPVKYEDFDETFVPE
jgi:DNA-directed RNA polymerase II subunit RPB1